MKPVRKPAFALFVVCCIVATELFAAERIIRTVAGTGVPTDNGRTGSAEELNIGQPFGVEIGPGGALFITEVQNHRVWRLDRGTRQLQVVAGNGKLGYAGDGGPATEAAMNEPYEIRFDSEGHAYVVEMQNHIVRRIDAQTGVITTIAGTGEAGFGGDGGPAVKAQLKVPHGIVLDGQGGLYIADIGNHRIRRVDLKSGVIATFAGTGSKEKPLDGSLAGESPLPGPRALASGGGALWCVLREGHSVWQIDYQSGRLKHVGGTGKGGYSGDGGPATAATFNGPKGLAIDPEGNLFIVDSENDAIRVIMAQSGTVTTIAGQGKSGKFAGDGGPAVKALLAQPHGICLDPAGIVYIGDTRNHRVREIAFPRD